MNKSTVSTMLANTTLSYEADGYDARWVVSATIIATLIAFIVVGNFLVLLALRASERAPAHYPISSLAVADLLVGLFVVPIAGVRELFVVQINWLICTLWKTLDVLCCTASILSLCLLGWERWSGITDPLAFNKRDKRARLFSALLWPIALAVAMPSGFIDAPKHHPGEMDKACPDNMNVTYVILSALLSFYLPAALMVMFYTRILYTLGIPSGIRAHRGRPPRQKISTIGKPTSTATGSSTSSPEASSSDPKKRRRLSNKTRAKTPQKCPIPMTIPEETETVNSASPPEKKTDESTKAEPMPIQEDYINWVVVCPEETGELPKVPPRPPKDRFLPKESKSRCTTPPKQKTTESKHAAPMRPNRCKRGKPKNVQRAAQPKRKMFEVIGVRNASRQRRASLIIVRVMALFLLCWTPYFVTLPIDAICECVWDPIWQWCTWLGYANSALNPLVYAVAFLAMRREMVTSAPTSSRATEKSKLPGISA